MNNHKDNTFRQISLAPHMQLSLRMGEGTRNSLNVVNDFSLGKADKNDRQIFGGITPYALS